VFRHRTMWVEARGAGRRQLKPLARGSQLRAV
jgi:hypothetical protein